MKAAKRVGLFTLLVAVAAATSAEAFVPPFDRLAPLIVRGKKRAQYYVVQRSVTLPTSSGAAAPGRKSLTQPGPRASPSAPTAALSA